MDPHRTSTADLPVRSDRAVGIAYGVGAGAVWGLAFLAPVLAGSFSPLHISVGRFLIYGLVALLLLVPRRAVLRPLLTRRHFAQLFGLAIIGNTLFYLLLVQGVQWGSVAMVALVMGFVPVLVTVIGSLERDAVPLGRLVPSMLLCVAGAVFIALNALSGSNGMSKPVLGLICALGALACWTWYAVANARILRQLRGISAHDWNLLLGVVTGVQAVLMLPLFLLLPAQSHSTAESLNLLAVVAGLAILCSLVGYTFWNRMSQLLPMTMIGQMIVFETIFALLYGLAWDRRLPTMLEMAALVCVVLGMLACVAVHPRSKSAH